MLTQRSTRLRSAAAEPHNASSHAWSCRYRELHLARHAGIGTPVCAARSDSRSGSSPRPWHLVHGTSVFEALCHVVFLPLHRGQRAGTRNSRRASRIMSATTWCNVRVSVPPHPSSCARSAQRSTNRRSSSARFIVRQTLAYSRLAASASFAIPSAPRTISGVSSPRPVPLVNWDRAGPSIASTASNCTASHYSGFYRSCHPRKRHVAVTLCNGVATKSFYAAATSGVDQPRCTCCTNAQCVRNALRGSLVPRTRGTH